MQLPRKAVKTVPEMKTYTCIMYDPMYTMDDHIKNMHYAPSQLPRKAVKTIPEMRIYRKYNAYDPIHYLCDPSYTT